MSLLGGAGRLNLVSLGVGLAAAGVGAAAGLAAEHLAAGRPVLGRPQPAVGERYGALRGQRHEVRADDGTRLHVEVDEPASGPDEDGAVTVVLSHGYALNLDCWHHQRQALRGRYRLVLWDQRGHGRSERGPAGSATIDQLGRDLGRVVDAVAPRGPLVLVGHSMGGMAVMSLAAHHRDLFADRVVAVALVSTSPGGLADIDLGIPGLGRIARRAAPSLASLLSRQAEIVERGRRIGSDLEQILVRHYSYASVVPPALVGFTAQMIASTRIEVVSDFLPTLGDHDKREALEALHRVELLVLAGADDLLIPAAHSDEIVRFVPGAEHVLVPSAGHLVMLEHPDVVTEHLVTLVERGARAHLVPPDAATPAGDIGGQAPARTGTRARPAPGAEGSRRAWPGRRLRGKTGAA